MNGNDKVNALLGVKETPSGGEEDLKTTISKLERELGSARVEQGRVKALDAKVKALEKELEGYKSKGSVKDLLDGLSEEDRGEVSQDYATVAATFAARAAKKATDEIREDFERDRRKREEDAQQAFVEKVERKYPGFFSDIAPGGGKNAAWVAFLEHNAYSVKAAFDSCDINGLTYHIDRFYREVLKVNPPRGTASPAAVDPESIKGASVDGIAAKETNTYTMEEYRALEKKAMDLRRKGKFSEYAKLSEELDNALVSGRVK